MKPPEMKPPDLPCRRPVPVKKPLMSSRVLTWALLTLSLVLLGLSFRASHQIFPESMKDYDLDTGYDERLEHEMVFFSTFSGVEYYKGRLYYTIDPRQAIAKPKCPT